MNTTESSLKFIIVQTRECHSIYRRTNIEARRHISAFGITLNYWYSLLLVTVTADTIKYVRWRACVLIMPNVLFCHIWLTFVNQIWQKSKTCAAHLALWVRMCVSWPILAKCAYCQFVSVAHISSQALTIIALSVRTDHVCLHTTVWDRNHCKPGFGFPWERPQLSLWDKRPRRLQHYRSCG